MSKGNGVAGSWEDQYPMRKKLKGLTTAQKGKLKFKDVGPGVKISTGKTGIYRQYNSKGDQSIYIHIRHQNLPTGQIWIKAGELPRMSVTKARLRRLEELEKLNHGEIIDTNKTKKITVKDAWELKINSSQNEKISDDSEKTIFNIHILPKFGSRPLKSITKLEIETWRKELKTTKVTNRDRYLSETYIYLILIRLKFLFNWAIENDLFVGKSPFKKIKLTTPNNKRIGFLTDDQIKLLFEHIATKEHSEEKYLQGFIALTTGLRRFEVMALKVQDIHFDLNRIILTVYKGKKKYNNEDLQFVSINAPLRKLLKNWIKSQNLKPSDKLWSCPHVNFWNNVFTKLGFNEGKIYGIDNDRISFHTLRHTFATRLAKDGIGLHHLKDLMRHSDIKMTLRYVKFMPDHRMEIMNNHAENISAFAK